MQRIYLTLNDNTLKLVLGFFVYLALFIFSQNAYCNNFSDTIRIKTVTVTAIKTVKEDAGKTTTRID